MTKGLRCEKCLLQRFDGNHVIHLGYVRSLRKRRDCRLCAFVLAQLVKTRASPNSLVFLKPVPESQKTYAIIFDDAESENAQGWLSLLPTSPPHGRWFGSRRGNKCNEGNKLDREQIKRWLHECKSTHYHSRTTDMVGQDLINLVLIDVQNGMLVDAQPNWEFVALSYVNGRWGGLNFDLDHFTKDDLKIPGALFSFAVPLPAVVKDAIDLVRDLGQRYLWCDFICIFRDNHVQKQAQIRQMDAIYSRALLTIIALSAEHGNIGLPGVRANSRDNICPAVDVGLGVKAVARAPELELIRSRSEYSRRGWTFQEEVLSQRCLYLTDSQAYFTCRGGYEREDGHRTAEQSSSTYLVHSNFFACFEQDASYKNPHIEHLFSLYGTLLRAYNERRLTYATDILDAFHGISKVLSRRFSCGFICGLPETQLHCALLWVPSMVLKRRLLIEPKEQSNCPYSPEEEAFRLKQPPTWSWAAWQGQVGFSAPFEDQFSAVSCIRNFGVVRKGGILPIGVSKKQHRNMRLKSDGCDGHGSSNHQNFTQGQPRIRDSSESTAQSKLPYRNQYQEHQDSLRQALGSSSFIDLSGIDLVEFVLDLFRPGITLVYEMVHILLQDSEQRPVMLLNVEKHHIVSSLERCKSILQDSIIELDPYTPTPTELTQSWTAIRDGLRLTYRGILIWPFKTWYLNHSPHRGWYVPKRMLQFLGIHLRPFEIESLLNRTISYKLERLERLTLARQNALCFFAYTTPIRKFSIFDGQLYEPSLKHSGLMTTGGGLTCDMKTLQFSKNGGIGGEIKRPVTVVSVVQPGEWLRTGRFTSVRRYHPPHSGDSQSSSKPEKHAGVLFDYEKQISHHTGLLLASDFELLLLSWVPPYDGEGTSRPAMWNMMLVKPVENGFYERVAIGRFREDVMLQNRLTWSYGYIRLA